MAVYTAVFNAVAVTAQQDFFELLAPSAASVIVHGVVLSQSTEVGDAQEEGLNILIKRGVGSTSGSVGGTNPTPVALDPKSAAAGSTVEINNTTKMSAGTITTIHAENWNIRSPFLYLPTPETRPVLTGATRLTVELATTPIDSITISGTITFEELG